MKRNFAYTAASVGSRLLVGLLLFLLLARLWGPAQFGLFSFSFSLSALLVLLIDFGFALFLMREVAVSPNQAPGLIAEAFWAKLLLTGAATVLLPVAAVIIGPSTLPPSLVAPLFLAAMVMSYSDFFLAPLRALGRFDLEAGVVTLANAVHFASAAAVAWVGGSLMQVAWAMVVARCLNVLLAWRALHKVVPQLYLFRPPAIRRLATLRRAWPYGIDGMLATAWNQIDVVAVRLLFGAEAVGLYSAGQKIVLGVSALAPVVGNVMIPRLSDLAAKKDWAFWRVAVKTGFLMVLIGAAFALPLMMFARSVTHFLFGQAYQGMSTLLPMFGGILLVRYLAASAGIAITAAGYQSSRVKVQVIGLAIAGSLTAILVPLYQRLDTFIYAYLLGLIAMTVGYFWWLWRLRAFWIRDGLR